MSPYWRRPPSWWPAEEPWPPQRRPPWVRVRRFFLLRLAWSFAILLALSVWGAVALVRTLAGADVPTFRPVAPLVLLLLGVVFALTMRRVGRPLGDIVHAAERVAGGDFGVHVAEHGPPWLRSVAVAFNSMTAKLAEQRRQRRDLMADVAHELRTPLAVMQGRLEGMLDGVYPRDERQVAGVLEETRLLARLVEDLRTLAHSESGTLALHKEPTDLGALVEETLEAFQREADDSGVTVSALVPADLPLLEVDPLRIREVVANLLSNAITHAPKGSTASIEVQARPDAVTVQVHDDGPGIPPQDVPRVFDRFYKGAASSGSGLGLTIARNLVTAHGGTIAVRSDAVAGTTFTVTLPV